MQLCQNFGIWGGGGFEHPKHPSVRHCYVVLYARCRSEPHTEHIPSLSHENYFCTKMAGCDSTTRAEHVLSIGALTTLSVVWLYKNHITAGQEGVGKCVGKWSWGKWRYNHSMLGETEENCINHKEESMPGVQLRRWVTSRDLESNVSWRHRVLTKIHPVPATSRIRNKSILLWYTPYCFVFLQTVVLTTETLPTTRSPFSRIQNGSQLAIALTRQNFFFLLKLGVIKTENVFPYTTE